MSYIVITIKLYLVSSRTARAMQLVPGSETMYLKEDMKTEERFFFWKEEKLQWVWEGDKRCVYVCVSIKYFIYVYEMVTE